MIFLAALVSVCNVLQSTFTKIASLKNKTSAPMYLNMLKTSASLVLFLIISAYKLQFHTPTLLYGSIYGVTLFFSTFFGFMALMNGSMALTSLLVSYSVIIPCAFGILFLNEAVSYMQIAGIIMLLVSMYLLKIRTGGEETKKKWFTYVAITFICNGICSVIQKLHQSAYPMLYCNEFMVYSLAVTFLLFVIISICKKEKKPTDGKKYAIVAGILMGIANYLTLVLSAKVNASVLFPVISISSMIINVTVSKLYFKDKLTPVQIAGIGLGVISVLFIK